MEDIRGANPLVLGNSKMFRVLITICVLVVVVASQHVKEGKRKPGDQELYKKGVWHIPKLPHIYAFEEFYYEMASYT